MSRLVCLFCVTLLMSLAATGALAQDAAAGFTPPGPNIALGKSYTLSPVPNYGLCRDPEGDPTHLTDAVYTEGYFWVHGTTVGWQHGAPAVITVDLEQVEPIAGVSFNTAAGAGGVSWPIAVDILVSDDGERWVHAAELVNLSAPHGVPPADRYSVHRFATDNLPTRARYVQFVVDNAPYIFVDEVEIYRGPDELLDREPEGRVVEPGREFFTEMRITSGLRWRLRADLDTAREAIREADLPEATRNALMADAGSIQAEMAAMPPEVPEGFTTILPLSDLHARIYALNAPLLRARGLTAPLYAWTTNPWDPLEPRDAPALEDVADLPALEIHMIRNEFRAAALNLTNTTDEAMQVTLNVNGLAWGPNPAQVSVREVAFTDTRERAPIAAALPDAGRDAAGYHVSIPAGCTRQVWFSVHATDFPADQEVSTGTVLVQGGGETLEVPFEVRVYPFVFPDQATVAVGGWDYTMGSGHYDATPQNIPLLIETLRAHHVNTPWATSAVRPRGAQFDQDGNLTTELDFAPWDDWVDRWPGSLWYCVFMAVTDSFEGEPMGTDRFNRMVGDYFEAWVDHIRAQGIDPEKFAVLLVDEPRNPEQDETTVLWARAIKPAAPEVVIWTDPIHRDPADALPELYEVADVIAPMLPRFMAHTDEQKQVFLDQQAAGKTLWLYSCSGPAKLLDPYCYFRGQFWWALEYDAEGSCYWAFADEANSGNSWVSYSQTRNQYSPLFIEPDRVTEGKQMAAIREGAQDYEVFVMLRNRVAELEGQGVAGPALDRARELLRDGPGRVIQHITAPNLGWRKEADRGVMDEVRVEVLQALLALREL